MLYLKQKEGQRYIRNDFAMRIRSISIDNFGTIRQYETKFSSGFNEIRTSAAPAFAVALQILLWNKTPSYPKRWIRDATKIEAVVQTKQADYRVVLTPDRARAKLVLSAFDSNGADRTSHYLQTVPSDAEETDRNIFYGGNRNIYFALKCSDGEGRADAVSHTRTFASYRRQYAMHFKPLPIRNGYFLALRENGSFAVEDARRRPYTGQLGESDERLARYLCFLQVAAFWDGFEQIRNIHHERKPLLLLDFLEYLDASVLASGKLRQAENLDRQILALTAFPRRESEK